ncbi:MAG TPA: hypothetical protein VHD83_06230 [Puia sp.]|nr:hypothetical protein [Puia sp.]
MQRIFSEMNKMVLNGILFTLPGLLLTGCATEKLTIRPAGFIEGFGNGFVSPFVLIGKYIFRSHYTVYMDYNTGWGYWSGFVIGVILIIFLITVLLGVWRNRDY